MKKIETKRNSKSKAPKARKLSITGAKLCAMIDAHRAICEVELSHLHFADYQREAITAHVNKLANPFEPLLAQLLVISVRGGKMWVLDGRQRSAAAEKANLDTLFALVYQNLTYEQEARLFYLLNQTPKQMAGWTKFHALLKMNDGTAWEIMDTLDSHHLTTPLTPTVERARDADVKEAGPIQLAHRVLGPMGFHKFCTLLDQAWRTNGNGSPVQDGAKRTDFLRGLIEFIKHYDQPIRKMVGILKKWTADDVTELARRQEATGRIDATQYTNAFAEIFGFQTKKRQKAS